MTEQQEQQTRPEAIERNFRTTGNPGEFYTALARAQAKFEPVRRNQTAEVQGESKSGKPYSYEFDFADLGAVKAATMPALNAEGFALIEPPCSSGEDWFELHVILGHASGTAECTVRFRRQLKIQETGSILTYLRRYIVSGLLGVAAEDDDDGNMADGNSAKFTPRGQSPQRAQEPAKAPRTNAPPKAQPAPKAPPQPASAASAPAQAPVEPKRESSPPPPKEEPQPEAQEETEGSLDFRLTDSTYDKIRAELKRSPLRGPKVIAHLKQTVGVEDPDALTEGQGRIWLEALKSQPNGAQS